MVTSRSAAVALLAGALLGFAADVALADPPSWAPAWGRREHDGHYRYRGYDGRDWDRDYGVYSRGHCNTDEILAVTGAVAGGVIGNRSAREENRAVATVLGAVIGAVVGDAIGNSIDDSDRACVGHTLELVPTGRMVTWRNPRTRMVYYVTPRRDLDRSCRDFDLRVANGRDHGVEHMRACRSDYGVWQMASYAARDRGERRYVRDDRYGDGNRGGDEDRGRPHHGHDHDDGDDD